jgi:TatA/E family protein of Tat protein translocase
VMLAFIESPIALIALFVIILICFGEKKVPEIANQIGRALGEFKRATSSFQQSMRVDDIDTSYRPTNYDSYGNPTDYSSSLSSTSSISEEDMHASSESTRLLPAPEPEHGDFAAAALTDDEYGYGATAPAQSKVSSTESDTPAQTLTPRPADSTVPRDS